MKKAIFLFLMFWKISIFSQTVGFATNINSKLKHIHAEVGTNVAVKFTEVLNYDASDFIKKLTAQTKTLNDFDFSILENNNVFSENKQREYLHDFCRKNNIDKIIVLYRNPFFTQYSPYKNLYRLKFDFGILTQERKKKVIYYMNRMILAYYDNKIDKLMPTYLSGEESFHREYYKRNSGEIVVDKESKKLINSSEVEADFIKDFENRLKQNFDEAMKK
ncbi:MULTISPECIES: hypothetical protein [unclassified Chryseobacterium]|uniref:hypothetical protein n=1 Tax=unclassified Chryseobacterium TaxID=2593645 RepID=UPI00226A6FBC|nr:MULTISPECIES: hypothetical protein [unclassified Chryseobacterium]